MASSLPPASARRAAASPLTLGAVVGQERALAFIGRCLAGGRLPHGLLFSGPRGVGKRTAAHALAATLNCRDRKGLDACGLCPSCRKMASGNHPDFVVLRPDGAGIKIGQVRELARHFDYAPHEGGWRIIVLEEAQTMARPAANSLLKSLEEPPPNNVFILTADQGQVLPATIRSRCQIVPFAPLPVATIAALLAGDGASAAELAEKEALAALAGGSLSRARELAEPEFRELRRRIFQTLHELRPEDPDLDRELLLLAADIAADRKRAGAILDLLLTWLRDLMLLAAKEDCGRLANRDLAATLARDASRWRPRELSAKLPWIQVAGRQLSRNCQAEGVFYVLFCRLLDVA